MKYRRHQKQQFKYGFKIPKDLADAYTIDKENGNNLWEDSSVKEMTEVQFAFKIIADLDMITSGYNEVTKSHLIFDIKIEDFCRKTLYVAG